MIAITDHAEGCLLAVRAQPGARREGILGEHNGALKIAVTAPPEGGRANKALRDVLRRALNLKGAQVELVGGDKTRDKRFLIRGLTRAELVQRLEKIFEREA